MTRTNLGLVIAGLLIGAGLGAVAFLSTGQPNYGQTQVSGVASVGGPFSLVDQTGKRVTEKDFLGRDMLVFFGYTNCPDVCPAGLQVMTAALEKLGSRADNVVPVFITLDPGHDTPEMLATYIASFHPRLVGLTGTESEISAVAKAYRVYYQKVADEKHPDRYTVDHSAIFYFMGKDGKLRTPIPHTTDVAELAASIDKAIE